MQCVIINFAMCPYPSTISFMFSVAMFHLEQLNHSGVTTLLMMRLLIRPGFPFFNCFEVVDDAEHPK